MKVKPIILAVLAFVAILGGVYFFNSAAAKLTPNGKLKVTASFYPMGEFARHVGGDLADVTVLVKPGVEPHDYDPTPADVAAIHTSKIFVYNGAKLEPWADKQRTELQDNGTIVIAASDGLTLTSNADPHVWLDPILAMRQVDNIQSAFARADPAHEAVYRRNAAAYKQDLSALDQNFRAALSQCTRHEVVTSHQAFAYLSARYGFTALGISGLSPDDEPSPQKLAEVAQFVRTHNIPYIFFETLASPKLSQTIASEVGAQTLVFNPLEGLSAAEIADGKSYLSVQRANIENLKIALDCR